MKSLMVGNKDTESALESKTRLYSSEAEIRQDQEKAVDAVLNKYSGFDYLKKNADLSSRVRTESLSGLREGIAVFMERKNIRDVRDVFYPPHGFHLSTDTYESILTELRSDPVLIGRLHDIEDLPGRECEHIAGVVDTVYHDYVLRKIHMEGIISSADLDNIRMPEPPSFVKKH